MIKKLLVLAIAFPLLSHCSNEIDNDLNTKADAQVEGRLLDLERKVAADAADDRNQEEGQQLTNQTIGETHAYLTELHKSINETRPEDLPEWQEMYSVLTDDAAVEDEEFGIGPRNLETNFHKLKTIADDNDAKIEDVSDKLKTNTERDDQQSKALTLVLERLATIDSNIKDLNKTVNDKFKATDKMLKDFDGRIVGVENRMKTVEIDLDAFRREFVEYKQRVTNIENILRRYDLARMHADIQELLEVASNHDERLIDLLGRVQINSADISTNRADLLEAEQELSGVSSEVGTLKAATNEIFLRLERCNCM